ncbi:glycosyltransferase [Terribacillus halophilus]|uniref:glycosyltransferase n=1 Tax=Terribacillus halophilus TaxID=361279 RepID=UPI0009842E64|nr:glycosyltransferase [Terribacillus halophilus]
MKDIVYIPWRDIHQIRKEGFRVRESNILKALLKKDNIRKVLLVNKAPNFKQKLLSNKSGMEIEEEIWANGGLCNTFLGSKLYKITDKMFSLELPGFLYNKGDNELESFRLIQKLVFRTILKASAYLEIDLDSTSTYLWSSDVSRAYIFEEIKKNNFDSHMIFDSIDNLLEHSAYVKKYNKIKDDYKVINNYADTVFSVSRDNLESLFDRVRNKYYISNGVDLTRFNNKPGHNLFEEDTIVCGYIGVIEGRIDFDLIKELARVNKDVKFKFTGIVIESCKEIVEDLNMLDNVSFDGPVSYNSIPKVLSSYDVCIIPHKINKFTQSMSPLKFYEYLASNKPIILTPVPPADEVIDIPGVYIANNIQKWNESINIIRRLKQVNYNKERSRNKLLIKNSWEQISDRMMSLINAID